MIIIYIFAVFSWSIGVNGTSLFRTRGIREIKLSDDSVTRRVNKLRELFRTDGWLSREFIANWRAAAKELHFVDSEGEGRGASGVQKS